MKGKISIDDLVLIFGKDFIPPEIDRKILMKHFEVGSNRIIGEKTVEKVKLVLLSAIETTRIEQFKDKGGVIESPAARLSPRATVTKDMIALPSEESIKEEDKYNLSSIKNGIVSQRLKEKEIISKDSSSQINKNVVEKYSAVDKDSILPTVEDLTVLSGGKLSREDVELNILEGYVQREISIRDYKIKDEIRSVRWGKEKVRNRNGEIQEIYHPAYIFHSDLWQIEKARESFSDRHCDILKHVTLDMIANNINVVMLENESEPFFVIEGYGILYSNETLKDKIKIQELIQLAIISCDAWQIALKRPESMLKNKDTSSFERSHIIDMTSVIPLSDIRTKIVSFDNDFKVNYNEPDKIVENALQDIDYHRKNTIWSCGASIIQNLRQVVKDHRNMIEKPTNELSVVVIGTKYAIHPLKIKYDLSGKITFEELLPDYCKKHTILDKTSIKNIFGSIPTIYDSKGIENFENEMPIIAYAISQRIGYSAIETQFDPGYKRGNPSEIIPISNLDIIAPPSHDDLKAKLEDKGFIIE